MQSCSEGAQSSVVGTNPEGSGMSWCLIFLAQPAVSKYHFTMALQ